MIVLDAFSSDAIPTHLLTREALRLYRSKLAEGGMIALHISNRYIDLAPVLGALAWDSRMKCLVRRDRDVSPDDVGRGESSSIWAVIAAYEEDLDGLLEDSRWQSPQIDPDEAVWTDDFSNVTKHFILRPPSRAGGKGIGLGAAWDTRTVSAEGADSPGCRPVDGLPSRLLTKPISINRLL